MKMGPDYIICSRVCFYGRDNGKVWKLKSINNGWIAWSNSRSSGRLEVRVGWGTIRGWVSVTEGARMNREEGWRGSGTGRVLPRPREGETSRRSRWTPLCNLFPFASASRTNVESTGGSLRAIRPDEPILYYHHRLSSANHPRKSGENFKKITSHDKSYWCSHIANGAERESSIEYFIQIIFYSLFQLNFIKLRSPFKHCFERKYFAQILIYNIIKYVIIKSGRDKFGNLYFEKKRKQLFYIKVANSDCKKIKIYLSFHQENGSVKWLFSSHPWSAGAINARKLLSIKCFLFSLFFYRPVRTPFLLKFDETRMILW